MGKGLGGVCAWGGSWEVCVCVHGEGAGRCVCMGRELGGVHSDRNYRDVFMCLLVSTVRTGILLLVSCATVI